MFTINQIPFCLTESICPVISSNVSINSCTKLIIIDLIFDLVCNTRGRSVITFVEVAFLKLKEIKQNDTFFHEHNAYKHTEVQTSKQIISIS